MLKRMLIGLAIVIFVLVGIHLSWGGPRQKCVVLPWTSLEVIQVRVGLQDNDFPKGVKIGT